MVEITLESNGITLIMADVEEFHEACGVPFEQEPSWPSHERVELRKKLIAEEAKEFCDACDVALTTFDEKAGDEAFLEAADALADLIYVAIGAALEFGIPLDRVWDEVQRTNMAKVDPATGKVIKREDGKILKPEGWTGPDIKRALYGEG